VPSLLALTGLNLDRAYPELGPEAADRRRSMAMTLLLRAISHAQQVKADALVCVGGLLDNRSVSPQSVSHLVQVLDAFSGYVLIAPSATDPYEGDGIYGVTNWGARTFVWPTQTFAQAPEPFGALLGRADWGRPVYPAEKGPGNVVILVGADLAPESAAEWIAGARCRHVITSAGGETQLDGVTVLAPVNPDLGKPWGQAALISYDSSGVTDVETVSLINNPTPTTVDVDVSRIGETDELLAALDQAIASAPEWSVVRLVGELAQGVQLPSTAGHMWSRDNVAVEVDRVGFSFTLPDRTDHTAQGEFVRSLVDADLNDRARHQAIALGLAALVPPVDEEAAW